MNDYNLEEINIIGATIKKNDKLLVLKSIENRFDAYKKILEIIILTSDNLPIIIYISSVIDVYKNMLLSMTSIDDINIKDKKIVILEDKSFLVNSDKNVYNISLSWSGETRLNIEYNPSIYNNNTQYLYWYDLNNIIFNWY